MLIEFRIASFSCVAFWKIDVVVVSVPPSSGGPRGGKTGCCIIGVATFETLFELLPERRPEEVLDPELRDLFR